MVTNPEQYSERTPLYDFITFLILVPATGVPLIFGFCLALAMPTWLAPPDANIWNTINLYVVVCELLWLIPTINVLRFRKFAFRKSHIVMFVAFFVFWGVVIWAMLGQNTSPFIFYMMDETTTCDRIESNNHVYYDCYGYFSDYQTAQPNQFPDWRAIFEGSPILPLVKVPCLRGWCN